MALVAMALSLLPHSSVRGGVGDTTNSARITCDTHIDSPWNYHPQSSVHSATEGMCKIFQITTIVHYLGYNFPFSFLQAVYILFPSYILLCRCSTHIFVRVLTIFVVSVSVLSKDPAAITFFAISMHWKEPTTRFVLSIPMH